ncbi:hypothetical protein UFOVP860_84 [uncultured Caudovirales phage]|uniref:Uncharacterized protein n=1 Tax=uncultured Caudovirales phage TaxID=2100421 RepID=A0A6J5T3X9_9CAUD|nr:hypothetical protein UFOVP860_84 [uncultured Caudovirales phage]CAB4195313.1 hypothetical protein UFOVP1293_27 [uncultured Caudovirales phage]CAB4222485.1 hypothetical protein UFOVP1644_45 [uncultured Caudovirales phage]
MNVTYAPMYAADFASGYRAATSGAFVPFWPESTDPYERGMAAGLAALWFGVALLP